MAECGAGCDGTIGLPTKLNGKQEVAILSGLFFLAFFLRAIPHLFYIPVLAIEESGQLLFALRLNAGDTGALLAYPHFHIALVVLLHRLTAVSMETIGAFIVPFLASLTVFPIYYLAKNMGGGLPLLSAIMFPFVDILIYRSIYLGHAEAVGILFLSLLLLAYVKRKWVFVGFLALALTQIHVLPLIVGIGTIMFDQLFFQGKFSLKRIVIPSLVVGGSTVALFLVFPYGYASGSFDLIRFDLSNIFLFQGEEYLRAFTTMGGSTMLFLFVLAKGYRKPVLGPMMLFSLLMMAGFWLFYVKELFSPFRALVYLGFAGTLGIGLVSWRAKTKLEVWKESQSYEQSYRQEKLWRIPHSRGYWLEFLRIGSFENCLEIGCGRNGLYRYDDHVLGLDPNAGDVVATTEKLPFRDASFDLAIICNGIDHYMDPQDAGVEMFRVAERGIIWVYKYPLVVSWLLDRFDGTHPHHLTETEILGMMPVNMGTEKLGVDSPLRFWKHTDSWVMKTKLLTAHVLGVRGLCLAIGN